MTRYFSILSGLAVALSFAAGDTAFAQPTRVLGLDISAHQGNLSQATWNAFHNVENRDFVFIRSSRGGTTGEDHRQGGYPFTDNDFYNLSQRYDDPYFVQNITRATAAGMFAGTYHRTRADVLADTPNFDGGTAGVANNGTDEANHMIQMAGAWMRPGYLQPALDFEDGIGARTDVEMAQFALDFGNRIYAVMGIRPAIYTNGNYAANVLAGGTSTQRNQLAQPTANPPGLASSPTFPTLWTARWPGETGNPYPPELDIQTDQPKDTYTPIYGPWDDYGVEHPWTFWQYASGGRLQSYENGTKNLDFNVARGGIEFVRDQLIPAVWMNNTSGDWSNLANWNSGQTPVAPVVSPGQLARVGPLTLPTPRLPGAAGSGVTSGQHDTVILERSSANITVTLSTGTHNIRKLYAREALAITGGSLTVNYVPSADSTPISAQFSAPVSLSGGASFSVHTLQVDGTRTFTVGGGSLTFNTINLMPNATTPAKIVVNGDMNFSPLANVTAVIAKGAAGSGNPSIDLAGANRVFTVANGAAAVDLSIGVPITNGGLTKSGAGALALSGTHSYAGDTSVLAGKLSLASPYLANAADVYLTSGATLDLTFSGGADVIDSLFIDGVSQQAGVWGAVGSGAPFTSSLITGAGRLQVTTYIPPLQGDFNLSGTVDATDLAIWRVGFGTMGNATRAQGDADGDLDVDAADFLLWQRNLGSSQAASGAIAAVPEPTSLLLMTALASALLSYKARGHRVR